MQIENNVLFVKNRLEYENNAELLSLSQEVNEILVETSEIHPSIFQLLLCLSKNKKVIFTDEFNNKFLQNLNF